MAHQTLDRAARHHDALAVHLQPDLVGSVDLPVGVPHALNVGLQTLVTLGACTAQLRVALPGCVAPVTRRGHLQRPADGLDPVVITVAVDVGLHDLSRRSSSAWAKNALAVFRMSLARRNLTSRSSSLMRCAHCSSAHRATTVNSLALDPVMQGLRHAADLGGDRFNRRPQRGYSPRCSCTMRTARHALPVKTSMICSWLHLLKSWSLKTRAIHSC